MAKFKASKVWQGVVAVGVAGALFAGGGVAEAKKNANPGVLPPQSNPHGQSYGDWSAEWWQWAYSIPFATNPVVDETGEHCTEGQSGSVWFLAGTFGGETARTCTIPSGKSLFFPIVNIACWAPEDLLAWGGNLGMTYDEQTEVVRECATYYGDLMDILEVTIDGVPLSNLSAYRAASGTFSVYLSDVIEDFGYPPGLRDPMVSDGYWLMLAPLTPGPHVIDFVGGISAYPFETHVNYQLTVSPGN